LADRFFPSTKRCSQCGNERSISLAERGVFLQALRPVDGPRFERGYQPGATVVLLNKTTPMLGATASSAESHACGEYVSPDFRQRSMMQEPNSFLS
jgi:uncharacterized OB-fold protein